MGERTRRGGTVGEAAVAVARARRPVIAIVVEGDERADGLRIGNVLGHAGMIPGATGRSRSGRERAHARAGCRPSGRISGRASLRFAEPAVAAACPGLPRQRRWGHHHRTSRPDQPGRTGSAELERGQGPRQCRLGATQARDSGGCGRSGAVRGTRHGPGRCAVMPGRSLAEDSACAVVVGGRGSRAARYLRWCRLRWRRGAGRGAGREAGSESGRAYTLLPTDP